MNVLFFRDHWPQVLEGKGGRGEATSMVQKAVSIMERTLGGELQRDSLLYFPGVRCIMALKALRVMAGKD